MTASFLEIFVTILFLVAALTLPKHSRGYPENSFFAAALQMYDCRHKLVEEAAA